MGRHGNMKAEIGVVRLQDEEWRKWPGNQLKLGNLEQMLSLSPQKEPAESSLHLGLLAPRTAKPRTSVIRALCCGDPGK